MKIILRVVFFSFLLVATVTTGFFVGEYFQKDIPQNLGINHLGFHKMLHLTPDQLKQLAPIEKKYAQQKEYYENQIRLANIELGDMMKTETAYTPEVQAVVRKTHMAMGQLQKITLIHFFEMRAILNDKQARMLGKYVADALHGP
ncbi:MAG: periplasmic heavy metal sensor [Alphaproteobacteria bacterium]|nr:periplasmic heavy metal sensor [Alphaproteobacteria bacterium]